MRTVLRDPAPPGAGSAEAPAAAERERDATAPDEAVRCAGCLAAVAAAADRIPLDGETMRAFVNPAGMLFEVVGFSAAPGCALEFEPTTHWSWFPGCAWQPAVCAACAAHLGWRFTGARDFFALIADRLVLPPAQ